MDFFLLAVNGTLMRGLELNGNLLAAGARFVREARTAPCYRLYSIGDVHPAMLRSAEGKAIALELWEVPVAGVASILQAEPAGLCIGKVLLEDGSEALGVLGEPWLCEGAPEITRHGGWREYLAARARTR
ncbi:MAG: gamma-glutamylcyclotransferase [Pseudomonadota bacterium]